MRKKRADSVNRPNAWRTAPVRVRIVFLLAVFFIFVGIGLATDVSNQAQGPVLRYALSVAVIAVFAVGYAAAGVILRGKFLMAILPLFIVQAFCMGLLHRFIPDQPVNEATRAANAAARLSFDGVATIVAVSLGYAGLVHVSISEARRHIATQTEKARLEGEMTAAREVQRLMVPEAIPLVPGYTIDSIYHPAAEVGGDFFQLIPLNSGHTLAVIGDVSGKGLSAAMVVSLIVGMLCVVSGATEDPGEILSELNRRLCGRMRSGFVTCLVVRLGPAGELVLATAGHPSPYLNGNEVALAGSMPLGLNRAESYGTTKVALGQGDRVVLLTDGIPEAKNEAGEIFGFGRAASLLREGASAGALAEAAQQLGQNDDITVIAISRQG